MLKPNTTARRVMRLLADALQRRAVAPHIFESCRRVLHLEIYLNLDAALCLRI